MNKTELIAAVAEKSGLSKKDSEKAVSSVIDTIIGTVASGEKIQVAGFGTFEQRQRNARTGCDPRTGKTIERHLDGDSRVGASQRHDGAAASSGDLRLSPDRGAADHRRLYGRIA